MKAAFKTHGPSGDPGLREARRLHEETLAARRRALGPEHADTLASMNDLAETLRNQGDLSAARKLHEEALDIRRRVLGPDHPDTLASMNNLLETYREAAKGHQPVLRHPTVFPAGIENLYAAATAAIDRWGWSDVLRGIGAAIDPLPELPRGLYHEDDASAYLSDWMALHADARVVLERRGYLKTGAGHGRTKASQ